MRHLLSILLLFLPFLIAGQTTFARGNHALELSGIFNNYLGTAFPDDASNKFGFDLRDARLILAGEYHPRFKYRLMVDFSEIGRDAPVGGDQVVLDAFVNFDLPDKFDLYVGFQRLPFSRNSNVSTFSSIFSRRPPISGGALYYRRDLGVVLRKKLLDQLINIKIGAFNGNGTLFSRGESLTYLARVDFSYPSKILYEEVDIRHSPVPFFSVGLNVLHSRQQDTLVVENFPLLFQGRKSIGAVDFALFYQGLSVQFEATRAWLDRSPGAAAGLPDQFNSYGMHLAANYYFKTLKSVFGARYEWFNPNDAAYKTDFEALTLAFNLLFDQSLDVVVRTDYRIFISEDAESAGMINEWHLGFQFRF